MSCKKTLLGGRRGWAWNACVMLLCYGSALIYVSSVYFSKDSGARLHQIQDLSLAELKRQAPRSSADVLAGRSSELKRQHPGFSTAGLAGGSVRDRLQQEEVHRGRLQRLRSTCAVNRSHYITATRWKRESLEEFVVDGHYQLAYCIIPKVGSSTLKRIFHILTGKSHGHTLFALNSRNIHRNRSGKYDMLGTVVKGETPVRLYQLLRSLVKIVFVRDPYERVFSAYIDRLFGVSEDLYPLIPVLLRERRHRNGGDVTRQNSCEFVNITFTDVISYVIHTSVTELDEHFSPYYSICFPCHLDYDYVGKLETFRHDLSVLLTSVGVDPHLVLGDDDAFDVKNGVNIIRAIVERTFDMMKYVGFRYCFTKPGLLKRAWMTFQVRGLLPVEVTFPLTQEEAEGMTLTQFDDLVKDTFLKVVDLNRLKAQRRLAMKEAFYSLPRELLYQLQSVIQRDCDLFGYECSVDARFKEDQKPTPIFPFDQL